MAAANSDPDWPCIQRKVPELSLGQIWNGPELPASAKDWSKDQDVPDLVKELAARRVPIAEAQKRNPRFRRQPAGRTRRRTVWQAGPGPFRLHERTSAPRSFPASAAMRGSSSNWLRGCARRRPRSTRCAAKPDANVNEIAARTDRLTWETRVFEERVQSLTYVCEVPTLIEQRLYALAKTVAEMMGGHSSSRS